MPIPFDCPHCGLETLVEDEYAGQSGPCASCGKQISVPCEPSAGGTATMVQVYTRPAKAPVGTIIMLGIGGIAAAVMVVAIAMVVLFPAFNAAREIARQRSCESNLERIGMALHAYEADHGVLPPAFIADEFGTPLHSWRVLILPYLDDGQGLYNVYDFDEAWDGPNNSQLAMRMPEVFGCPADRDAFTMGESNYRVILGPGTPFPDSDSTSMSQVTDDPSTTILVVETPGAGIGWLDPRGELRAERMQFLINSGYGKEISSNHDDGAHVLMIDGTIQLLSDTTPSDYIEGMTTTAGNEPIVLEP